MTKTHLERFNTAYDTLNELGAATKGIDATEGLGFDQSVDQITLMTSRDGHPRQDGYRAIGWLMTSRTVNQTAVVKTTYIVNAFCTPAGEITSLYADRLDAMALYIGAGPNHGYPLTERDVPDQTIGAESALVLIEQAIEALPAQS